MEQEDEYKQWDSETCCSEPLGKNPKPQSYLKGGCGYSGLLKREPLLPLFAFLLWKKYILLREMWKVLNIQSKEKQAPLSHGWNTIIACSPVRFLSVFYHSQALGHVAQITINHCTKLQLMWLYCFLLNRFIIICIILPLCSKIDGRIRDHC